jgi:proteasome lid subunit RPN8/RPN11
MKGLPRELRRDTGRSGTGPVRRLHIRLPEPWRDEILRCSVKGLPNEACGLLLGHRDDPRAEVLRVWPAANILARVDRYEIPPETVLAADRAARQAGQLLLGAWHSHPGGAPLPSATDRAEAWPDWCYLIIGLADARAPELRAWRLLDKDFVEDELEIT